MRVPPTARRPSTRVGRWALGAALAVAVLAAYAPASNLGFTNFDDPQYVLDNQHVRSGLTWNGIAWSLTATHAGNWHPVTWWSHMIDVELHGLNPRGHHVSSVLIHLVNTLLVFALLGWTTGQPLRSAVVAALFGTHPLHVESVAWIAERKDVLSTFFAMLTLSAYVRYIDRRTPARYGLVLLFLVVGLASKPMLVTLPFLLLLLDVWPLGRVRVTPDAGPDGISRLAHELRPLVLEKVPLFLCALASSIVTYLVQQSGGAVRAFDALPFGRRLANAVVSYVSYIGRMIWPTNLAPLYPYSLEEPLWRVAFATLLLVALTWLAVRAAVRYRYVAVGWFWYLGTLVPVIGLVQVGSQPMADRYTYLPLVGLFIVIVWGLPDVLPRLTATRHLLAAAASAAIVISVVLARQQVAIWGNSIDLWQHTLRVTRNNYRAHNNLAHALATVGRPEDALSEYRAALRINPDSVEAHTGIGDRLAAAGKLDEAISHYRRALAVSTSDTPARANLGIALAEQGRFAEAEAHLRAALEAAPDLPLAHSNLGVALARQGRMSEAIGHLTKAVELQPSDGVARCRLGSALAMMGRTDDAVAEFQAALRLDPDDAQARNSLGDALAAAGKLEAATVEYERAVRLSPAFAEARANLGNTLARLGRTDEAVVQLVEAVRIKPEDFDSRYDLAVVLWRKGRLAEAREQLEVVVRQAPDHEAARRMLVNLKKVSPDSGPER